MDSAARVEGCSDGCGLVQNLSLLHTSQSIMKIVKVDTGSFLHHWGCATFTESCVMPPGVGKMPVVYVSWLHSASAAQRSAKFASNLAAHECTGKQTR